MSLTHDVTVDIREEQKPGITAEWLTIIRFGPEGPQASARIQKSRQS